MSDEIDRRDTAGTVGTYVGPDSIRAAGFTAVRARAAAALAIRAHVDEVSSALVARNAERDLGRMLLAGRAAGDVVDYGRPEKVSGASTLTDLGVPRDLAADAVTFARVPNDVWEAWLTFADDLSTATHRAFTRGARAYLDELDGRDAERRRAERAAVDARTALERLLNEPPPVEVPPLTPDETAVISAAAVGALADSTPGRVTVPLQSVEQRAQFALMRAMGDLARQITEHDPSLTGSATEVLLQHTLARDVTARLVTAATAWLRTVNTLASEDRP